MLLGPQWTSTAYKTMEEDEKAMERGQKDWKVKVDFNKPTM